VALPRCFDQGAHVRDVRGEHPGSAESNLFEPLSSLAFLAGKTSTIRLGVGVLIVPYRNPVLTAKMLAMIDVFSQGRLTVGVGVGWMREEFVALSAPAFETRGWVTDQYVRQYLSLWTGDATRASDAGSGPNVPDVGFLPRPVQQPHPPIWVGGNGPAAMRRAARLGAGWMPVFHSAAEMAQLVAELHAVCEEEGREPRTVNVAVGLRFRADGAGIAVGADWLPMSTPASTLKDELHRYEDAGVSEIHLLSASTDTRRLIAADVIGAWSSFLEKACGTG
jgi:probable F420-dependent oxidoreductase